MGVFPSAPSGVEIHQAHPERSLAEDRIRALVRAVVRGEDRELGYLSVVLADHETVTRLNRQYLDHDYHTDVLSFPLGDEDAGDDEDRNEDRDEDRDGDGDEDAERAAPRTEGREAREAKEDDPPVEGEIYVDLDTAAERSDEFGNSYEQEAARYLVHGLLHLVGYDDESEKGRERMKRREERYLS